jgi:predicted Zn-dependent peptidase
MTNQFNLKEKVQTAKLKNGLNLFFAKMSSLPLVTVNLWVRVGSVNEPKNINGISHFLEHILFKDTKNYPNNLISKEIDNIGGYINAATSLDYTHYYITLHSSDVEKAFKVISDMAYNLKIDKKNFEMEKGVIIEEIQRGNDSPVNILWENLYKNCLKGHNYSNPIIGNKKNILDMQLEQLEDYYSTYYSPENMFLVVSGDIEYEKVLKLSAQYFGIHTNNSKIDENKSLVKHKSELKENLYKEKSVSSINQTYFVYAWQAPCIDEKYFTASYALSRILGEGISSRLYKVLKQEDGIVWSIAATLSQEKYSSLFVIYGTCDYSNLPKIEEKIFIEIQNISQNITEDDLTKIKKMVNFQYQSDLETSSDITDAIGYYEIMGDWRYSYKISDILNDELKLSDIIESANQIFSKKFVRQVVKPKNG